MTDEITALTALHESRQRENALSEELALANDFLQHTAAYLNVQALKKQIKEEQEQQGEARKSVSDFALLRYKQDGSNKQPLPGVSIRINRVVLYDHDVARKWCMSNLTTALSLNEKSFEETMRMISKNNAPVSPLPDFVKVEEEPSVTIASDLSKCLPESSNEQPLARKSALELLREVLEQ
jgi:hypothetical protein